MAAETRHPGSHPLHLSPGHTPLQDTQSPDCTGCLLRGLLAVTTVGLSLTSRRQLQDTPASVMRRSAKTSCIISLSQFRAASIARGTPFVGQSSGNRLTWR